MVDLWTKLMTIDDLNFTLVVMMSVVAAFLLRELLGGMLLMILGFPCLVVAALAGHAMFREFGIEPATDKASNLLIGSMAGMIFGFAVYVITVQLFGKIAGR